MNIIQRVRFTFDRYAEEIFLIEALTGRQFSYSDFFQFASRASRILYANGVGKGDRVALLLSNSAEFAALYFGCLFLGAVAVPVNPALHTREIGFILTHSGLRLLVCSPATSNLGKEFGGFIAFPILNIIPKSERSLVTDDDNAFHFETISVPEIPDWKPLDGVGDGDLYSITFTSGTTGVPKGVAHRVCNLFNNAISFNQTLGFRRENRFLHVMAMSYMAGFLNTLICPFIAGSSVVLAPAFNAQTMLQFWQPVIQYQANTLWLSPTMLTALLRVDRDLNGQEYARNHIKAICVGTAPLPVKTKNDFERKYGLELFESYGLSELLFLFTNSKYFPCIEGSAGRALPNVEVKIADDNGNSVEVGIEGEIWIKTSDIMAGYLNYDTLEPDPIDEFGWFPTGDVGCLDDNKHLYITGRKKDLIITGGINVSPRAIEEILMEHDAVEQAAVVGLPHDFYGEEVAAVLKLKSGYDLASQQKSIEALCKQELNENASPTRYFSVAQFPVNSNGKFQKHKLREQLVNQS